MDQVSHQHNLAAKITAFYESAKNLSFEALIHNSHSSHGRLQSEHSLVQIDVRHTVKIVFLQRQLKMTAQQQKFNFKATK